MPRYPRTLNKTPVERIYNHLPWRILSLCIHHLSTAPNLLNNTLFLSVIGAALIFPRAVSIKPLISVVCIHRVIIYDLSTGQQGSVAVKYIHFMPPRVVRWNSDISQFYHNLIRQATFRRSS